MDFSWTTLGIGMLCLIIYTSLRHLARNEEACDKCHRFSVRIGFEWLIGLPVAVAVWYAFAYMMRAWF